MQKHFLDIYSGAKTRKGDKKKEYLFKHIQKLSSPQWRKELQTYTRKELENIICMLAPRSCEEIYEQALTHAFHERKSRLNSLFVYTNKNVKKLLWVNQKLMECFEKAYQHAQDLYAQFQKDKKENKHFADEIDIEISVTPFLPSHATIDQNPCTHDAQSITEVLQSAMENDRILRANYSDKPLIYFDKAYSWNIEGFGSRNGPQPLSAENSQSLRENVFANNYISYAMHELYSHSFWSLQDIIRIQQFYTEVHVCYQNFCNKKHV